MRFYAGAPLTTESGHKVGALYVLDISARRINEQQVHALAILAKQVVARMELRQKRLQLDEAVSKLRRSEDLFHTLPTISRLRHTSRTLPGRLSSTTNISRSTSKSAPGPDWQAE